MFVKRYLNYEVSWCVKKIEHWRLGKRMSWVLRPNPDERINREPEGQKNDHRTENTIYLPNVSKAVHLST